MLKPFFIMAYFSEDPFGFNSCVGTSAIINPKSAESLSTMEQANNSNSA